jgi:3-phosphoshikimate 1-carboxyvinyltransferase
VRSHGDHRVAMAFGILASLPGNQITLDDRRVVDVSFPQFWNQLELCGR